MDREPLPDYFRRFVQKKSQTPNFSEKAAIEKCTAGLLSSQLASHISKEPPKYLAELYSKVVKYPCKIFYKKYLSNILCMCSNIQYDILDIKI